MYTFSPATKAESAKINQNFTDLSTGVGDVDDNKLALLRQDIWNNFALSGLVWSKTVTLTGAMTTGIAYISNGTIRTRILIASVTSKVFTASKDTYITVDSAGAVTYTEVANGATPPVYASNTMPLAKIITDGTGITTIIDLTPRNFDEIGRAKLLLGVTDSLAVPNLPVKTRLFLDLLAIPSGQISPKLRFNNDSASNYTYSYEFNGGASTTAINQTQLDVMAGNVTATQYGTVEIINASGLHKMGCAVTIHDGTTASAGTAPAAYDAKLKYSQTTNITRIDFINTGTGDFSVGTEIVIKGKN